MRVVHDVLPYKFSKLMYNAAISPLAAAGGLDNGSLLREGPARRLFFALLQENYRILRQAGKPLGTIGPFSPGTVQRILNQRWLARSLAWAFYPSLKGRYCSMSLDLPAGRTEIDNYNGYLLSLAGNVSCPLNRLTYAWSAPGKNPHAAGPSHLDELEQPFNLLALNERIAIAISHEVSRRLVSPIDSSRMSRRFSGNNCGNLSAHSIRQTLPLQIFVGPRSRNRFRRQTIEIEVVDGNRPAYS